MRFKGKGSREGREKKGEECWKVRRIKQVVDWQVRLAAALDRTRACQLQLKRLVHTPTYQAHALTRRRTVHHDAHCIRPGIHVFRLVVRTSSAPRSFIHSLCSSRCGHRAATCRRVSTLVLIVHASTHTCILLASQCTRTRPWRKG